MSTVGPFDGWSTFINGHATRVAALVVRNNLGAKRSGAAEIQEHRRRREAKVDPHTLEQLNVRVRRRVNVLLKKLDYLCAERGVDTNKQELVQFWLSQLPSEVTDDLIDRLVAFKESEATASAGSD